MYFNPLHHEGGDSAGWNQPVPTAISIHSTTRVETFRRERIKAKISDFNPVHHEGGDNAEAAARTAIEISIHSTTRVETF